MIIKNGLVFDAKGFFRTKCINTRDNLIYSITDSEAETPKCEDNQQNGEAGEQIIDAKGMYVIPGLIDIHLHGCDGYDFCDASAESIQRIADYELSCGITSICPTTMTLNEDKLTDIIRKIAAHDNEWGAGIVGINMEGPFISADKVGAQNSKYIQSPDVDMFLRLQNAALGMIKIVDIAPETKGAMDFIETLSGSVNISIAHTNADYLTTIEAFEKGANHVTHLYNAMPALHHRNPGVIGAAADCEKVFVELIADGVHCDPAVVRTSFKIFGEDRIVFISDSMEACAKPEGEYSLGGQKVFVKGRRALLADGTIAGSVSNLMDCVRNSVINMNIPLERAVKCASLNPAKSLGISDRYGSLEPGKIADIVILNTDLEIRYVIKNGRVCL